MKREERKEKRKSVPSGLILIIFARKYLFFSLFTFLYSLGCCILQRPLQFAPKAHSLPRGGGWPRRGRETAPAGACGEQPPKAALSERRNAGSRLRFVEVCRLLPVYVPQPAFQQVLTLYELSDSRPHSSSVRKPVPKSRFSDSFSPGEAKGAAAPEGSSTV